MMTTDEMVMYDMMVDMGIATSEEINLARCLVNGTWQNVLEEVLYVRTGYNTLQQLLECEEEE